VKPPSKLRASALSTFLTVTFLLMAGAPVTSAQEPCDQLMNKRFSTDETWVGFLKSQLPALTLSGLEKTLSEQSAPNLDTLFSKVNKYDPSLPEADRIYFSIAFRNRETGHVQWFRPNIDLLPNHEEWQIADHQQISTSTFVKMLAQDGL